MWYAIISQDVKESLNLRKVHRPAHLKRLKKLEEQGRVLLAGPHPSKDSTDPGSEGFSGSLVVVEFDSIENAKDWAAQDPYQLNGVYESVQVKPFIKVFPTDVSEN